MAAIVPLTLNASSGISFGANYDVDYFVASDPVYYVRDNEPMQNLAMRDTQMNNKLTEIIGYLNTYAGDGLTGAGDQPIDLNIGNFVDFFQPADYTLGAPAANVVVTVEMAGKTPNGSSSAEGVLTNPSYNLVTIKENGDDVIINDPGSGITGAKLYGRITYAAAVWTLTFYVINDAGTEVAYNCPAGTFQWYVPESFYPWNRPFPPYFLAIQSDQVAGLSPNQEWDAVVDVAGTGDFTSIYDALTDAKAPKRIYVMPGAYDDTGKGVLAITSAQAQGMRIYGSGIGITTWQFDSGATFGQSGVAVAPDFELAHMTIGSAGSNDSEFSVLSDVEGAWLHHLRFENGGIGIATACIVSGQGAVIENIIGDDIPAPNTVPDTLFDVSGGHSVLRDILFESSTSSIGTPVFILTEGAGPILAENIQAQWTPAIITDRTCFKIRRDPSAGGDAGITIRDCRWGGSNALALHSAFIYAYEDDTYEMPQNVVVENNLSGDWGFDDGRGSVFIEIDESITAPGITSVDVLNWTVRGNILRRNDAGATTTYLIRSTDGATGVNAHLFVFDNLEVVGNKLDIAATVVGNDPWLITVGDYGMIQRAVITDNIVTKGGGVVFDGSAQEYGPLRESIIANNYFADADILEFDGIVSTDFSDNFEDNIIEGNECRSIVTGTAWGVYVVINNNVAGIYGLTVKGNRLSRVILDGNGVLDNCQQLHIEGNTERSIDPLSGGILIQNIAGIDFTDGCAHWLIANNTLDRLQILDVARLHDVKILDNLWTGWSSGSGHPAITTLSGVYHLDYIGNRGVDNFSVTNYTGGDIKRVRAERNDFYTAGGGIPNIVIDNHFNAAGGVVEEIAIVQNHLHHASSQIQVISEDTTNTLDILIEGNHVQGGIVLNCLTFGGANGSGGHRVHILDNYLGTTGAISTPHNQCVVFYSNIEGNYLNGLSFPGSLIHSVISNNQFLGSGTVVVAVSLRNTRWIGNYFESHVITLTGGVGTRENTTIESNIFDGASSVSITNNKDVSVVFADNEANVTTVGSEFFDLTMNTGIAADVNASHLTFTGNIIRFDCSDNTSDPCRTEDVGNVVVTGNNFLDVRAASQAQIFDFINGVNNRTVTINGNKSERQSANARSHYNGLGLGLPRIVGVGNVWYGSAPDVALVTSTGIVDMPSTLPGAGGPNWNAL